MKTIVTEKYDSESMEFTGLPVNGSLTVSVCGQVPDRSCEDRDVYIRVARRSENYEFSLDEWFRGEDAIALGEVLIRHGRRALMANITEHFRIHRRNEVRQWVAEGRVASLRFTVVDEHPANHGSGFRTYRIEPRWNDGMAPEFVSDDPYHEILFWSPFADEYEAQLAAWGAPIVFDGYDRDAEVAEFERQVAEMDQCGPAPKDDDELEPLGMAFGHDRD